MGIINGMKFLVKQEAFKNMALEISIKFIESLLVPKVLFTCEARTNLTKKNIEDFEKMQNDFIIQINSLPISKACDGIIYEF